MTPPLRGPGVKALEIYRSVPRYLAARSLAARVPALAGVAPLRLADRSAPREADARLGPAAADPLGICGSDLGTVGGHSSFYFSALVSMPFTPGHEVVAELLEDVTTPHDGELKAGSRVVLDPQLALRRPRCRAVPVVPRRPAEPLRPGHARSRQPGAADRLLQGHRRWLVRRDGGPSPRSSTAYPTRSPMSVPSSSSHWPVPCASPSGLLRPRSSDSVRHHRRRCGRAADAARAARAGLRRAAHDRREISQTGCACSCSGCHRRGRPG